MQPEDASPLVQLLLRNASEPLTDPERLAEIRSSKAPLVVGTPQAVLEVIKADASALPLEQFSTVAVDEVDTLVEIPPVNAGTNARIKFEKNLKRHPSPTRQILDAIYRGESALSSSAVSTRRPQLVMMSATLNKHHRQWLQVESGWFESNGQNVVGVYGTSPADARKAVATSKTIVHHAIVISPAGEVANIEGTVGEVPNLTAAMEDGDATEVPVAQNSSSDVGPDFEQIEGKFDVYSEMSPGLHINGSSF